MMRWLMVGLLLLIVSREVKKTERKLVLLYQQVGPVDQILHLLGRPCCAMRIETRRIEMPN